MYSAIIEIYRKQIIHMEKKNRLVYLDIARGIAMISIVLGHLRLNNINRVVFTYHLPIFFIISGFFINTNDKMSHFVKKKVRTLVVPYIIACVCVILSALMMNLIFHKGEGFAEVLKTWSIASIYGAGDSYKEPFQIQGIGAIWFLLATFWALIMLKSISKINKWLRVAAVFIIFYLGIFTRDKFFWFPLSIQAGCTALLFIYIGYLIKENKQFISYISKEAAIFGSVLLIIVWLSFIRDFQSFWLVHCDIGRGFIDIIGSLGGCLFIILLSRLIESKIKILAVPLSFLGKNSLIFLIAHIIELNTFKWMTLLDKIFPDGSNQNYYLPIVIILKFIWIITFTVIFSNIKSVRKLLGMPISDKD